MSAYEPLSCWTEKVTGHDCNGAITAARAMQREKTTGTTVVDIEGEVGVNLGVRHQELRTPSHTSAWVSRAA